MPSTPGDIRAQLDRLLAAPSFQSSERHRNFLRYTVAASLEGRLDTLKEYTLAVEVFNRRESFDPQTDPIVRVEASRIRAKLKRYYESEGRDDAIRVEYPKGGYAPAFAVRAPAGKPAAAPPARSGGRVLRAAAVLLALGAGCVQALKLSARPAHKPGPAPVAVLPLMASDPAAEVWARAFSRELVRALARRTDLTVRDASGAPADLQARRDVRDIGAQLGAVAVVGGTLRVRGARIRLSVELVDALNGYEIASATDDATLRELRSDPGRLARSLLARVPVHLPGY